MDKLEFSYHLVDLQKREGIPGVEEVTFKTRLVVKDFTRFERINYNEGFSPVVKHCSVRILMAIVNEYDLEFEQLGVNIAFLHGGSRGDYPYIYNKNKGL